MGTFIFQRLLQSLAVLLAVSIVMFLAVYAVGDPVEMLVNPETTQLEREAMVQALGLDQPVWMQYLTFMGNAFQGDLGISFVHGEPALRLIVSRLPATFELVTLSLLLASLIGIPIGLYVGLNADSSVSRTIMTASILGYSLPSFWKGMMLILLFAVWLHWLPTSGRGETVDVLGVPLSFLTLDGLRHMAMPAVNLAVPNIAMILRLTASGAMEAQSQDYVKFARAKGIRRKRIVRRHILRNILIPIVTVIGLDFGGLIAFSTITETVFAWPGMGKLLIDSIGLLDRPIVVAYLLITVVMFILINLVVDLLYSVLDPRVRLGDLKS